MGVITLADYNGVQSTINQVLGKGTGTYGYGQNVLSSQILPGTVVSSAQWNNLASDILKCRRYQTGDSPTVTLPTFSSTRVVTTSDLNQMQAMAAAASSNRIISQIPSSPVNQGTRQDLIRVPFSNWKTSSISTQTIDFASGSKNWGSFTADDAMRFYFNTGSVIEFSATLTGSSGTTKDNTWITMFSNMGTIRFGYNATTRTGVGSGSTTSSIGYSNLTTADQVIFTQAAPTGAYSSNYFRILARKTGTPGQLVFTVQYLDAVS